MSQFSRNLPVCLQTHNLSKEPEAHMKQWSMPAPEERLKQRRFGDDKKMMVHVHAMDLLQAIAREVDALQCV